MKKGLCLLNCLILVVFLLGCQTATVMETKAKTFQAVPIVVKGSKPIAFHRIIFKIEPGKAIGGWHDGLLRRKKIEYNWQAGISVGSDDFRIAASEEMRNFGYTVLGAENILFGEDESAKARYQLGGIIKDIQYNIYAPLAGGFSEAGIKVEWQLQDTLTKQTIFTLTTDGYNKQKGNNTSVIILSFRNAIRKLLSDQAFWKKLSLSSDDEIAAPKHTEPIKILLSPADKETSLPDDIEDVMQGVIVIKVGKTFASGFFVSEDGYALTAAHVVSGVKEIAVQLKSGLQLNAKVVRVDEPQDLALIKVEGKGHKPLKLMIQGVVPIGTELFAIGAPAGEIYSFSVCKGIVSGHREKGNMKYLQTDASINPGNSGGPLLDKTGKVVGIVSWKIVAPGFEGLSFGVPLNVVATRLGIEWETE